jgi:lipopolysaccharide export system protein LptA
VRIRNGRDSLSAGYFSYNFKSSRVEAESNVYLQDREHLVEIWGKKSLYLADSHFARVEQHAKLMRVDSAKGDTLLITAGKLEYREQDPVQAVATDSVWIRQGKLKARCDTAIYFVDDERVWLRASPEAWYDDNIMSGKRMRIQLDSMEVKNIHISEKAKAVSLADSAHASWNVLKGKEIHLVVFDKKPQRLQAAGNASSVYYLEDDKEKHGVNYATSDTILIYFKTGKADSISIRGGSEGVYYPENYKGEKAFGNDGRTGRIKKP